MEMIGECSDPRQQARGVNIMQYGPQSYGDWSVEYHTIP